MTIYLGTMLACWALFIAYWVVSGMSAKRTVGGVWRGMGVRAVILIVAFVLFRDDLGRMLREPVEPARAAAGDVLCVVGLAFAVWARVHLGRNWGMPRAVKEGAELVTSGPYAFVRHPIYTGMLVALVGSVLVAGWFWLFLPVLMGAYFIYSALGEEQLMLRTFPGSYPGYRERTKMLVPFVL